MAHQKKNPPKIDSSSIVDQLWKLKELPGESRCLRAAWRIEARWNAESEKLFPFASRLISWEKFANISLLLRLAGACIPPPFKFSRNTLPCCGEGSFYSDFIFFRYRSCRHLASKLFLHKLENRTWRVCSWKGCWLNGLTTEKCGGM